MRPIYLVALFVAGTPVMVSQQPTVPQDTVTIRTNVREVLLDLVIRDRHEKFVRDLAPGDVEVYEDGLKQDVTAFRLIEGREARQAEEQLQRELKDKGKTEMNPVREINLVSLVFKMMGWEARRNAKDAAEAFLKNELRPNTYIAIFSLDYRLHALTTYTNDRQELLKAIQRAASGAYSQFGADSQAVLNRTEFAAVGGQGGVSISGGGPDFSSAAGGLLPASIGGPSQASSVMYGILNKERVFSNQVAGMQEMDALEILIQEQARLPGRKTVVLFTPGVITPVNFQERFRYVMSSANRAGVTFYGIDVNGLTTNSSVQASRASLGTLEVAPTSGVENVAATPSFRADDSLQYALHGNPQESLEELTRSTGGFTISNTNDYKKNMRKIMEDVSTHYELAYAPKSDVYDGHFRKIEVKMLRPNLAVQARSGYFALPELNGQQLRPFEVPALNALSSKPRPHDFELRAAALRFHPGPVTVQYGLVFEVPVRGIGTRQDMKTNEHVLHTSILALIKDARGDVVEKVSRDLNLSVPDNKLAQFQKGNIIYTQPVFLPPGRYTVESSVVDRINTKASVQRWSLVIARPANGPEISNPTLVRGLEARKEAPDAADPFQFPGGKITPTLAPSTTAGSAPVVFFTVYPAGGSKEKLRVYAEYFKDGKLLGRETPDISSAKPSEPVPVVISPKSLDPGLYDVRITAIDGPLAARQNLSILIEN